MLIFNSVIAQIKKNNLEAKYLAINDINLFKDTTTESHVKELYKTINETYN